METTEQNIRQTIKDYEAFDEFLYERLEAYAKITSFYGSKSHISWNSWEFYEDHITYTNNPWSDESTTERMPIEYLWDKNWIDKANEDCRISQEKEAEKQRAKEDEWVIEEREEYERLKAKFETLNEED